MRPEEFPEPVDSTESPEPSRPSLDPSEEEALFQHLRRYRAHHGRRRQGRKALTAGTVVAGAALLVVVASLAPWTRPEAPQPEMTQQAVPSLTSPELAPPRVQALAEPRPPRVEALVEPRPVRAEALAELQTSRVGAPPAPAGARPDLSAEPGGERSETPVEHPASRPEEPAGPPPPAITGEPTAPTVAPVPATPVPSRTPARDAATVRYQPRERLAAVSAGDTKERVFDRFATTFEERNGAVLRIDGMRWRANGRSPHHAHVEVADVVLADAGTGRVYWFLFGDGRLLAWGRPEEWPAAARRREIEIDYRPAGPAARPAGGTD